MNTDLLDLIDAAVKEAYSVGDDFGAGDAGALIEALAARGLAVAPSGKEKNA